LTRDRYAFVSQHVGDLENEETLEHFARTVGLYERLFRVRPAIVAHDMHPDYLSTRYAIDLAAASGQRLVPVQHHHAHIVSGMVDAGINGPVIGVAFDGTGFGPDGNIWGGEFLVADYRGYTRIGHLQYLPLAGGDAAVKKPYRTAIGYLLTLLGEDCLRQELGFLTDVDRNELDVIIQQIKRRLNSPLTSSCGRLFDAVSSLIGVRSEVQYDAQAAIELEMMAHRLPAERGEYPFSVLTRDGVRVIGLEALFHALLIEISDKTSPVRIAARFHNTVARMISSVCRDVSKETGLTQVVLSGGVFQNRLLSRRALTLLGEEGLKAFVHHQVPCNDGGISLGQAVVGATVSR
jgi:hydrogenase maturation protein HypF